jgi:hypothetical protein
VARLFGRASGHIRGAADPRADLRAAGWRVSEHTVAQLMREQQQCSIAAGEAAAFRRKRRLLGWDWWLPRTVWKSAAARGRRPTNNGAGRWFW